MTTYQTEVKAFENQIDSKRIERLNELIKGLIAYEPDLNAKLDMLTSIATTTQNDDVWHETENVRDELCKSLQEQVGPLLDHVSEQEDQSGQQHGTSEENPGENGHGLFT